MSIVSIGLDIAVVSVNEVEIRVELERPSVRRPEVELL